MFRFYSASSRTQLLRPTGPRCCKRLFHPTTASNYNRPQKRSKSFKPITELPKSTEDLSKCLHNAYTSAGSTARRQADNRRVNVVSKELCSDILDRMKPSLLQHSGCDIIDVNPGAGVWSSAVHDLLQPRSHIMLEPDYEMYQPLLQPLLDEEGSTYKLYPKSGVVWGHLNSVLTPENLPRQIEYTSEDPRLDEPNNTLLFIANLGWHPRKAFKGFPSISMLVAHQFLSATRAHSLFQRYGLVRMLLWVSDEEGQMILPRSINLRRKFTIESELSCSRIVEVASSTQDRNRVLRNSSQSHKSSLLVRARMDSAGVTTPPGRAGEAELEALRDPNEPEDALEVRRAMAQIEVLKAQMGSKKPAGLSDFKRLVHLRKHKERMATKGKTMGDRVAKELELLEAREFDEPAILSASATIEAEDRNIKKMYYLRARIHGIEMKKRKFVPLQADVDAIIKKQIRVRTLHGARAELLQRDIDEQVTALKVKLDSMTSVEQDQFRFDSDGRNTFENEPSLLMWDRRESEPLKVLPTEFYPKQELCLLDFHPQAIWPVLRKGFPATYDTFEFIVGTLCTTPNQSVREGLTNLAPGAYEALLNECPSIRDVTKGGNPDPTLMTVRCLTTIMWKELTEAWMRWPFRPTRSEMLRRTGSNIYGDDDGETMADL